MIGVLVLGSALFLSAGATGAETLNPGNVNPHAEAPRKRIGVEQKKAAADARKKKKAEISARKAADKGLKTVPESPSGENRKHDR